MRIILRIFLISLILIPLPLLGPILKGEEIAIYLEFPPKTHPTSHPPFSLVVFIAYCIFLICVITPFLIHLIRTEKINRSDSLKSFPWWGWLSIGGLIVSWILAWTRFKWFSMFQPHTFTPIWISYIFLINALTYKRKGSCLFLADKRRFFILFLTSAAFWWFFEYLNRFIQNWYYVGKEFGSIEYFIFATLPFSTVLPAILSTKELILTFSWPYRFERFKVIKIRYPKLCAIIVLLISGLLLSLLSLYREILFPFVWISPVLIVSSFQTLMGEENIFTPISRGDWKDLVSAAGSALVCGFFWEMWNFYSFSKWKYNIPYVDIFHIFEMPLLGYGGYLPFGLECLAIYRYLFDRRSHQ